MPAPSVLTDLSATAASNYPADAEAIGSGLDDYLRGIQAALRGGLAHKGADIASAATTNLSAVQGLMHDITGTTTITSFGTGSVGLPKILQFDGALTLTHNATSLVLPGGANITTAAGDIGLFICDSSGNWRCVTYFTAATGAYVNAASDTARGVIELAIQSEMETATDVVRAVTPGRQHFHPGHPKCWAMVTVSAGTPTLQSSYNITSITDTATGRLTVTIATDFSSANWCCIPGIQVDNVAGAVYACAADNATLAVGSVVLECWAITGAPGGSLADPESWHMVGFGDQA